MTSGRAQRSAGTHRWQRSCGCNALNALDDYATNYKDNGGNWTKRILYGDESEPAAIQRIFKVDRDATNIRCWLTGRDSDDPPEPHGSHGLQLQFRRDNDVPNKKNMHIALPAKFPQYSQNDSYLWKAANDLGVSISAYINIAIKEKMNK